MNNILLIIIVLIDGFLVHLLCMDIPLIKKRLDKLEGKIPMDELMMKPWLWSFIKRGDKK